MKFEPALITQLVGAGLALCVAFGLPVTEEQREAILVFMGIVVAIMIGQGVIIRSNVYSQATTEQLLRNVGTDRRTPGAVGQPQSR